MEPHTVQNGGVGGDMDVDSLLGHGACRWQSIAEKRWFSVAGSQSGLRRQSGVDPGR